jgi:adenylate kinase
MKTAILFLGPPGCGKGTQSGIVLNNFAIISYSIGDLLRSYAESNNQDSATIKNMIEKGIIVPGSLTNSIVAKLVDSVPKVFILDGYPRNLEQANFLNTCSNIKVIPVYFKLDKDLLLERVLNRWQCKNCGLIYGAKLLELDVDKFKCSGCGLAQLYKRSDDNYEVLQNRIEQFTKHTFPVLNFYKNLNLLHEIDASQDVNEVNMDLSRIIKNLDIDIK